MRCGFLMVFFAVLGAAKMLSWIAKRDIDAWFDRLARERNGE